ncbi:MAG TPA: hypothetical protein VGE27_04705 [Gemmatimonas sp.]|uniref:hypothetical protein n=1 Tax=Gemmatimonas sp. TaxID=1962908 RepID=UPI002EDADADE
MSVCIIAAFPWDCVKNRAGISAPGVVVCSDTRVTYGKTIGPWWLTKQSMIARNIVVCYTSSHAEATSLAISKSIGSKTVKRIGDNLRAAHAAHGGFTELVAVVWRQKQTPQVLELMPPKYAPAVRTGIIGIGDGAVLDSFKVHFRADLDPEPEVPGREQMELAWERQFGKKLVWPTPFLPIETAAKHVVEALSGAIENAGGPTVALPVQLMTITQERVQQLQATSTADLVTWSDVTTSIDKTRFAPVKPAHVAISSPKRSAVQLFP